jgi:hypothetical protein
MGLEAAIITTAAANSGFANLIGTSSAMRLRPVTAAQSTIYPNVTYRVISEVRDEAMGASSTVIRRRVEFQVHSNEAGAQASVIAVVAALKACFDRFSGTVGSFVILDTFIEGETDLAFDLDTSVYTRVVDTIFICGA